MPVTFTCRELKPGGALASTDFRCNETGVHYQLDTTADGYVIRNSGNVVAHRTDRELAVNYIGEQAEADLQSMGSY